MATYFDMINDMNEDYVAKTIQAYDNAPDKFVSATDTMLNEIEMNIMLELIREKTLPILDVGSGSGKDAQAFTDKGYKTIGIDLSKQLISRAKTLHPEIEFKYMDVRNLEFQDGSFAAVWCNAVLLHLNDNDLEKALREIFRVLARGGVVAVSLKEGEGQREVLEKFSSELARFYNFKSEGELNKFLSQAGFTVAESHKLNERERFGPDKRDLNWVWSFGVKE